MGRTRWDTSTASPTSTSSDTQRKRPPTPPTSTNAPGTDMRAPVSHTPPDTTAWTEPWTNASKSALTTIHASPSTSPTAPAGSMTPRPWATTKVTNPDGPPGSTPAAPSTESARSEHLTLHSALQASQI